MYPTQRSGAGRRGDRRARCIARFPDRRPHAARGADRRRLARRRARHAVPAVLLHHRRRAAAEGQGTRVRRGSRRRCRNARRACGDSKNFPVCSPIPKRSSRRSIRCSRGSIRSRPRPKVDPNRVSLTRRCRALPDRAAQTARRRFDFSRRPRRRRATRSRSTCRRRTPSRLPRRSVGADHHDRAGHRHRAVPRLPARAHGDAARQGATGCSSAISAATAISSTRTS